MANQSISDFEDKIASAKEEFFESFKEMLELVKSPEVTTQLVQEKLTELHAKGVTFFSLFGRSLNEYGLDNFATNPNIRNSKIDDAIHVSNTILKYWSLLNSLKEKYDILIPKPSERAYGSIQLFLKTFEKEKSKELELKFQEANLPVSGFVSSRKFIDMTKKQQITYGIIVGTIFLVALLVIGIVIDCPTNFQNRMFTTILALSAASFSAAIPGFINVKYREVITASGALAVFAIVFLMKPADLSDFKSCQENVSGTVYFGENPLESVNLMFIKQNKSTMTDNFGNFNIPLDVSAVEETIKIKLYKEDIQLDTVMTFAKTDILKSMDIFAKKYCVLCVQKDSTGSVLLNKRKCSASTSYLSDYIEGFLNAGSMQGRLVECKRE